jgi:hypothetical protein
MATNCMTDNVPATLPSTEDLDRALDLLRPLVSTMCDLQWRVRRIARGALIDDNPEYALVEGDEIPTFAHIGSLYVFVQDARARLAEVESYVTTIDESLVPLDSVRMLERGVA